VIVSDLGLQLQLDESALTSAQYHAPTHDHTLSTSSHYTTTQGVKQFLSSNLDYIMDDKNSP